MNNDLDVGAFCSERYKCASPRHLEGLSARPGCVAATRRFNLLRNGYNGFNVRLYDNGSGLTKTGECALVFVAEQQPKLFEIVEVMLSPKALIALADFAGVC